MSIAVWEAIYVSIVSDNVRREPRCARPQHTVRRNASRYADAVLAIKTLRRDARAWYA